MNTKNSKDIANWAPSTPSQVAKRIRRVRIAGLACIAATLIGSALMILAAPPLYLVSSGLFPVGAGIAGASIILGSAGGLYVAPFNAADTIDAVPASSGVLNLIANLCKDQATRAEITAALSRNGASAETLLQCDAVSLCDAAHEWYTANRRHMIAQNIDAIIKAD